MSVWKDKINRTILISSIFIVLIIIVVVFFVVYPYHPADPLATPQDPPPGLGWAFLPAPLIIIVSFLFWMFYLNMLLLVGSIREKMNALPGWTELLACAIATLLPAIFVGNTSNFAVKWVVFGATFLGVLLITLWFIMTSTKRETIASG